MKDNNTNIEDLFALVARQNDVIKRVKNGGLKIETALAGTRAILENKITIKNVKMPRWYKQSGFQVTKAKTFYSKHGNNRVGYRPCDIDDLVLPTDELNEGEMYQLYIPLETLQETADALWEDTEPPKGYEKWRWPEIKSDAEHLRMVPGTKFDNQCKWVIFNPYANQGKSPEWCVNNPVSGQELAHVHVLMAAYYFNGWAVSWNGKNSPYPNISGLQLKYGSGWSIVPCVHRSDGEHQLKLSARGGVYDAGCWSSPVFRECGS